MDKQTICAVLKALSASKIAVFDDLLDSIDSLIESLPEEQGELLHQLIVRALATSVEITEMEMTHNFMHQMAALQENGLAALNTVSMN